MAKEEVKKKSTVRESTPKETKVVTEPKFEKVEEPKIEETAEEVEVKEVVEEKPKERKKAIDIDLHEFIEVRSVTNGGLSYKSPKTGVIVRWRECGDTEYIEFTELMTMKSSNPRFLNEPLIVIDDEDVVAKLGLSKLYEDMFDVDKLEEFFEYSVTKMTELLETMPSGIKTLIGDRAVNMIKDETLYDLRKIKLLEDKIKIDLQILMD